MRTEVQLPECHSSESWNPGAWIPDQVRDDRIAMRIMTIVAALMLLMTAVTAEAWQGRRAVLYSEAQVMLQLNEPYRWGTTDCSGQMWRLMKKVFPELGMTKWFRRTTADAMAGWPWQPVMSREKMYFGDLCFSGHPRIDHVLMAWVHCSGKQIDDPTAIHAAKSRGFSETDLKPYWWPKIEVIVRPPY